jgi:hypothetical protein
MPVAGLAGVGRTGSGKCATCGSDSQMEKCRIPERRLAGKRGNRNISCVVVGMVTSYALDRHSDWLLRLAFRGSRVGDGVGKYLARAF